MIHVGAGLSTAAGIRDFRGKNGVWTELLNDYKHEQSKYKKVQGCNDTYDKAAKHVDKKLKIDPTGTCEINAVPSDNIDLTSKTKPELKPFDETEPTLSHMALKKLCQLQYVTHIVSQNVDGLFLKSGLNRKYISELHGNFYLDECTCCRARFIRCSASKTMKLTKSSTKCPKLKEGGKQCKGYLRDTILDWESAIPPNELRLANKHAKESKLHICIGTSLQLSPSKDLVCNPLRAKSKKLVIINLQPTKFDERADLVIHYYADFVMSELMSILDLSVPEYDISHDPTKLLHLHHTQWLRTD